jgi:hypothetical protein
MPIAAAVKKGAMGRIRNLVKLQKTGIAPLEGAPLEFPGNSMLQLRNSFSGQLSPGKSAEQLDKNHSGPERLYKG